MLPCASIGLWRGVRYEVLGGLCKATQFLKVEKRIRKTRECLSFPVHVDQMQLLLPLELQVQLAITSEDLGIIMWFAPFSLLEHWQNSAQMFHWFYLPNISCENTNLMGTSMYPVVPMEMKPKEEEVYTLNLPVNGWVAIGLSGINHSFFFLYFSVSF